MNPTDREWLVLGNLFVEQLADSRDAGDIDIPRGVVEDRPPLVVRGVGVVVGGRNVAARRVVLARQVAPEPLPLVLSGPGDGQPPGPPVAVRRQTRYLQRDVPLLVAADQIVRRQLP